MARSANKTTTTSVSPEEFIGALENPQRQADARVLLKFFRNLTGWKPKMWGPSMIGFGSYHYRYETGREGDMLVTGFSPRKANLVLYIMPGYNDLSEPLRRLGKHRIGKSCLYINKLADVNMDVLEEIVRAGVAYMKANYPVSS
jgi:hypothetical protein